MPWTFRTTRARCNAGGAPASGSLGYEEAERCPSAARSSPHASRWSLAEVAILTSDTHVA
jgi:hypothetical protein